MLSEFIKYAARWRVVGGHAQELKLMGYQSTSAGANTAVGDAIFPALTSGVNNAAFGVGALTNITSGSNNFAIGKNAGTDGVANVSTASNVGVLGNNNTATIYAKVALTVTSDERDKTQFEPLPWTLELLSQVKVGRFQFRERQGGKVQPLRRYGFSAQNLMAIEQQVSHYPTLVDSTDPEHLKLNESMMLPILVKMVQDLYQEVKQLKAELGYTE